MFGSIDQATLHGAVPALEFPHRSCLQQSERLTFLGILGVQFRTSMKRLEYHDNIVQRDSNRALNCSFIEINCRRTRKKKFHIVIAVRSMAPRIVLQCLQFNKSGRTISSGQAL